MGKLTQVGQSAAGEPPGLTEYQVLVVTETDRLVDMARETMERLGKKLRRQRSVTAAARRFAGQIAADPAPLRIRVFDVVGFCTPRRESPEYLEPFVILEGRPVPVSTAYEHDLGVFRITTGRELTRDRGGLIAACARQMIEEVAVCEAVMTAVDAADPDCTLTGYSCDPRTLTVDLCGDVDGKVAKRLPRWVAVENPEDHTHAT